MKTLIIATPYNKRTGVGVPGSYFEWLSNILSEIGIFSRLIKATTTSFIQSVLDDEKPDIVFSTAYEAKGIEGQKNTVIHQLLDTLGIPYIGSSPETLELALSKSKLKARLRDVGIPTPDYYNYRLGKFQDPDGEFINLPTQFPYILKPCREGNSRGISEKSIVWDEVSMLKQIKSMSKVYPEILIEHYLGKDKDLREFTIAMIGNGPGQFVLPAEIKLLARHPYRIITLSDKLKHSTQAIPINDSSLERKLSLLARSVFETIDARDYARCDVLLSRGELQVIEVNGQPMIPDKWIDACAQTIGMNRRDYCLAIFYSGISRYARIDGSNIVMPEKLINAFKSYL